MSDLHVARLAALFESVAIEYDQDVRFFTAFAEQLIGWAAIRRGERALDIGTGRGHCRGRRPCGWRIGRCR